MNEQFLDLRDQYQKLQETLEKEKSFYEEALEARMNQIEEFEQQVENLTKKVEDQRGREIDLQAHIEQLEFDMDLMRRKGAGSGNPQKQEEMLREMNSLQEQM